MSIDWLLTRLGGAKSLNDVTQNTGKDINNHDKANNSQPKKAGKDTDLPAHGHSNYNSKKRESSSLHTEDSKSTKVKKANVL